MPPLSNFNKSCLALAVAQSLTHGIAQAATITVETTDALDETACGFTDALITINNGSNACLLYTSPSPRDLSTSRMPSSA